MEVQEVAPKDQHIDGSIPSHEQAPNVEEPMTHITGPPSALDTPHGMTSGKVFLFFFEEDGRPPISIKENKHRVLQNSRHHQLKHHSYPSVASQNAIPFCIASKPPPSRVFFFFKANPPFPFLLTEKQVATRSLTAEHRSWESKQKVFFT